MSADISVHDVLQAAHAAEPLPAAVIKQIAKELKDLQEKPEEGIKLFLSDDNIADVQAEYEGPAGTPYEDGTFRMKMILGPDFPNMPPKGYFLTKIFHPNVSKTGEICVNVLKRDWKSDLGLRHVLVIIRCLLIEPFPESALNEEAGKLLLENYEEYAKHAKLMTSIHAQPPKRSMPLTAAGGANAVNSTNGEAAVVDSKESVVKKPKAQDKLKTAAAVAKKRGLKRL
ncbi:hypothetical protein WJX82_006008 [Trebouxia sp. C0006]